MIGNQSTIAEAISKEVEWLEDINKIFTAGKTETETRSVSASIVGERTINHQSKVRNKTAEAISWSAFHVERQEQVTSKCTSSLLPLFSDCAHSAVMISLAITVISKAVEYLNLGQTVAIACDQPLFALAKTIQWAQKDVQGRIIWWPCLVALTAIGNGSLAVDGFKFYHKLRSLQQEGRSHPLTAHTLREPSTRTR